MKDKICRKTTEELDKLIDHHDDEYDFNMCLAFGKKQIQDYKHNKTGKNYTIFSNTIINATNKNDGEIMVLYTNGTQLFVREKEEFNQKFTKMEK